MKHYRMSIAKQDGNTVEVGLIAAEQVTPDQVAAIGQSVADALDTVTVIRVKGNAAWVYSPSRWGSAK